MAVRPTVAEALPSCRLRARAAGLAEDLARVEKLDAMQKEVAWSKRQGALADADRTGGAHQGWI